MPPEKHKYLSYQQAFHPKLQKLKKKLQRVSKRKSLGISPDTSKLLSKVRSIIGKKMPLGEDTLAGADSFPGPDVTYSPGPKFVTTPIVNLGCMAGGTLRDIVPLNVSWPDGQPPREFPTGSNQPNVNTIDGTVPGSETFQRFQVGGTSAENAVGTPFQATVNLIPNGAGSIAIHNLGAIAHGFSQVTLSEEGILWTLWPLVKPTEVSLKTKPDTYFDKFILGTATESRYPIGQMGFFINNQMQGCTPIGSAGSGRLIEDGHLETVSPGTQELNKTILITTEQQLAIVVVKVSEEIARIYNPIAGVSSNQRFLYVGYDGWAIVYTTANPLGPVAAQTYVSPQPFTTVGENYQVLIPPNFPKTVYYKNVRRILPWPEPRSIDAVTEGAALTIAIHNPRARNLGLGATRARDAGQIR